MKNQTIKNVQTVNKISTAELMKLALKKMQKENKIGMPAPGCI